MAWWNLRKKFQYVQQYQVGQPVWSTQKDKDYILEAYNQVVWVYACVSLISSAVSSVPWTLYRKGRGGRLIEIDDHPILTMLNNRANPYMSSSEFFDMWATYLAIEGKFYAEYIGTMPTQMFPVYPHCMKPIPSSQYFVEGFEYQNGATKVRYNPDQILWSKFTDPLDIYQGLSPIRAMARTIDTENEAVNWNKSTLQNNGVPAGVFSVVNPTPELQQQLKEEWLKRYAGSNNARLPLILNADKAQYQQLGLSATDMDFLNQRKLNRTEICAGFGVPSQIVGDPEGQTYSNYGEAQKAFWENTIVPKYLKTIQNKLQQDLLPKYNSNLVIKYDLSNVGALKENLDKISARTIEQFKSNLITLDEARYALEYEQVPDKGSMFYQELSLHFVSESIEEQQEPKEDVEPNEDPQEMAGAQKGMKTKSLYEEWKSFEASRVPFYKTTENEIKKIFEDERISVVDAVNSSTKDNLMQNVNGIIEQGKKKKIKLLTAVYLSVFEDFGNKEYNKLKPKKEMNIKAFDIFTNSVKSFIAKTVAEKVVMIDDTTRSQIKSIVNYSFDNELSIDAIAELIDNLYLDQIIPNRSRTIARTEVISAANKASLEGAKQSGAKVQKYWIPTQDEKTRESHLEMGGQPPIDLDQDFIVNGFHAGQPGDPKLPASECINCRCAVGYKRKEE